MKTIIDTSSASRKYNRLLHYSNFNSLKLIMSNKTLMLRNLNVLNDKYESKRKGIEQFSKSVFVSCFCNQQYEIVPFWYDYGGDIKENKVLLKIKNFSNDFDGHFLTDYFITGEAKPRKIAFEPAMWAVSVKDIRYLHPTHKAFRRNYSSPAILSPNNNPQTEPTGILYDITELGEFKTIHWKYERETRIICKMGGHHEPHYENMFLQLKEKFFEGMEVILNPWCSNEFAETVSEYIVQSAITDVIKNSITVSKSELHNLLL